MASAFTLRNSSRSGVIGSDWARNPVTLSNATAERISVRASGLVDILGLRLLDVLRLHRLANACEFTERFISGRWRAAVKFGGRGPALHALLARLRKRDLGMTRFCFNSRLSSLTKSDTP